MKTCRFILFYFLMTKFKNNFGNVTALEKNKESRLPFLVDLNTNQHL